MKEPLTEIKHGAVVLGGHVQSLGIVRILGQRGIPVSVIDNTSCCIARRSRFCGAFHKVRDEMLEEFLNGALCRSEYKGWVIFPTNDMHVKILSANREKLQQTFIVSTDRWDAVKQFYNKRNTYRLAEQAGVPIPATFFPEGESDLDNPEIPYPCIVKPAVMVDFYSKVRKKVFLCRDRAELMDNYRKALEIIPAGEIIIQEVVPGDGRNQYSACFLFLNGHSYAELTACRMRQHPLDFGNATTYAEAAEEPEIIEFGKKLLGAVKYNGVCEVEFKRDARNGKFRLLEVNPRTWKWHAIAEKTSTPFLPLYFDYLTGREIQPVKGQTFATFCHSATDIPVRLLMMLKGSGQWRRKLRPVQNAVWSDSDPAPWFYEKLYLLNFLVNR